MRDIPIIFSAQMVRALLSGDKTMTRRLALNPKGKPSSWTSVQPGDRLWCRENIRLISQGPGKKVGINYAADGDMGEISFFSPDQHKLKRIGITPCIHQPRWASRLTLTVKAVKIERLHDIPLLDVRAEGVEVRNFWLFGADGPERQKIGASAFRGLWESIHGSGSWIVNPDVVAISFTVIPINIDRL